LIQITLLNLTEPKKNGNRSPSLKQVNSFLIFLGVLGFLFVFTCFYVWHEINEINRRLADIESKIGKEDGEFLLIFLSKIHPLTYKQEIDYIRLHSLITAKMN